MHYVVCYPVRKVRKRTEILLGYMKQGLWEGYFNGFGGKMTEMINSNVPKRYENLESPIQCAIRELEEETGMKATINDMIYHGNVVFTVKTDGITEESLVDIFTVVVDKKMNKAYNQIQTEVAIPCWFDIDFLPFEAMPPYDQQWIGMIRDYKWMYQYQLKIDEGTLIDIKHRQSDRKSRI